MVCLCCKVPETLGPYHRYCAVCRTARARLREQVDFIVRQAKPTPEPCQCGADSNLDRHHDDYSKPLDIRWLCGPCHVQWHMDNRPVFDVFKTARQVELILLNRPELRGGRSSRSGKQAFIDACAASGLSKPELANRFGVEQHTLDQWERGVVPIPSWCYRLIRMIVDVMAVEHRMMG